MTVLSQASYGMPAEKSAVHLVITRTDLIVDKSCVPKQPEHKVRLPRESRHSVAEDAEVELCGMRTKQHNSGCERKF